jgi:ankyrin repeat protein
LVKISLDHLFAAVVDDDCARVKALLTTHPTLTSRTVFEARLYEGYILHWLYVGDTALHLAAAGHRVEIVSLLLAAGANPNAAAEPSQ